MLSLSRNQVTCVKSVQRFTAHRALQPVLCFKHRYARG
jgi:hypothetical protein